MIFHDLNKAKQKSVGTIAAGTAAGTAETTANKQNKRLIYNIINYLSY